MQRVGSYQSLLRFRESPGLSTGEEMSVGLCGFAEGAFRAASVSVNVSSLFKPVNTESFRLAKSLNAFPRLQSPKLCSPPVATRSLAHFTDEEPGLAG